MAMKEIVSLFSTSGLEIPVNVCFLAICLFIQLKLFGSLFCLCCVSHDLNFHS